MPLRPTIYVQVFANRFLVRNVDTGASTELPRDMEFSSPRMLIADFTVAEQQLRKAVRQVGTGLLGAEMLVHPMELIEGGVTQVERRTFVELGIGAGASKVAVWSGVPLNGEAVKSKFVGTATREPNPSIERTSQRPLRALCAAAHAKR